jgi:predicted RNA-binding Zn ribbon-like protein
MLNLPDKHGIVKGEMSMSADPASWLDLLNSDWHDHRGSGRREDRLLDPRWLSAFLKRWGLKTGAASRASVVSSFRVLRTVLRRLADSCAAGGRGAARDWAAVNARLKRSPFIEQAGSAGGMLTSRRVPLGRPLDSALAAVASSFVDQVVRGDPTRVKICRNKDCLWVFYDRSRNKSRRWCEDTCANLMKVRAFRRRNAPRSGAAPGRGER